MPPARLISSAARIVARCCDNSIGAVTPDEENNTPTLIGSLGDEVIVQPESDGRLSGPPARSAVHDSGSMHGHCACSPQLGERTARRRMKPERRSRPAS